jgi:N-acetylglucosaminyldiphosphoundecaprenol N-acetyl-beta-D-mannosaminyltransferase
VIDALRERFPAAYWIGVGISLSFMAGTVTRAPRWLQRMGLEWAHRLVQEPRRLARRYLLDDIPFTARLLFGAWRARR